MSFLKNLASALGDKVVAREITYGGVSETFYFRRLTGDQADELGLYLLGEDGQVDRTKLKGNLSRQIASCLCDEHGKAVATAEEVGSLPVALRTAFYDVYREVNPEPGKAQKEESESGSTSP